MDENGDSSDDESDDKTGDESNDDTPQGKSDHRLYSSMV